MELTVSGILSRMLATVKDRIGPLIGLWAIFFVVQMVSMFLFVAVIGGGAMLGAGAMDSSGAGLAALGGGMIVMMILFYLLYLLIYVASYGSMAHMASPLIRPQFGESFSAGIRAALPLLGAMVLLIIAYFVLSIPLGLVFGGLAAVMGEAAVLLAVLIVPLLVYFGCRLSILFPLATVEGIRSPVTLITRSWSLTGGHVLPIFLAVLAYVVIAIALFAVVLLPMFGPLIAGGSPDAVPGIGSILFLGFGGIIVGVLMAIMGAALGSAIHAVVSDVSGDSYSDTFA